MIFKLPWQRMPWQPPIKIILVAWLLWERSKRKKGKEKVEKEEDSDRGREGDGRECQ